MHLAVGAILIKGLATAPAMSELLEGDRPDG
jgi:hypothetical protein